MSVLALGERPESEQIAALEQGFPSSSLSQLVDSLGLSKQMMIAALRLAQRTVNQREKTRTRFTPEESERILRVVRVRHIVRDVFTSDKAVAEWLSAPDAALGTRTPLEMLATGVGASKVENLARAMVHGVPI